MERTLHLGEYGEHLWTRDRARDIRVEIVRMLNESSEGDLVSIDAKGVEVFDYSFANELFGKTLLNLSREYPGRFVIVENLTAYTAENLTKALESLNLAMIHRKGKRLELIGKVHPTDANTFAAIAKARSPVTAAELKDALGTNLTAMNERLSKLTGLALIRRQKAVSAAGREQYQYTVLN